MKSFIYGCCCWFFLAAPHLTAVLLASLFRRKIIPVKYPRRNYFCYTKLKLRQIRKRRRPPQFSDANSSASNPTEIIQGTSPGAQCDIVML